MVSHPSIKPTCILKWAERFQLSWKQKPWKKSAPIFLKNHSLLDTRKLWRWKVLFFFLWPLLTLLTAVFVLEWKRVVQEGNLRDPWKVTGQHYYYNAGGKCVRSISIYRKIRILSKLQQKLFFCCSEPQGPPAISVLCLAYFFPEWTLTPNRNRP